MNTFGAIVIATVSLLFFVYLCLPSDVHVNESTDSPPRLVDRRDREQIGRLVGVAGGDVVDAAVICSALQRFEAQQGRPATTQDIGVVLGLAREIAGVR